MIIRGPDGLHRTSIVIDGQLCVQIVDPLPLLAGEVEIEIDFTRWSADDAALDDLLSRCSGGGAASGGAVTGGPNNRPRGDVR